MTRLVTTVVTNEQGEFIGYQLRQSDFPLIFNNIRKVQFRTLAPFYRDSFSLACIPCKVVERRDIVILRDVPIDTDKQVTEKALI